jgi:hypothetical protein
MELRELLNCIPSAARYVREPMPDSRNALWYWSEAAEKSTPIDHDLWDRCVVDNEELEAGQRRTTPPLDEITTAALRGIVDRNSETLELLRQGVACGQVQFPEMTGEGGSVSEHADSIEPLRELSRIWWARARLLLTDGRPEEAASDLIGLGDMAHLVCCGESLVLHYLVGCVVQALPLSGIKMLAAEPVVAASTRRKVREAVERWIHEADLSSRCQCVDLCDYAIPEMAKLAEAGDTEAVIDRFLERHYLDRPLMPETDEDGQDIPDSAARVEWRRDAIRYLLSDHPQPFDLKPLMEPMGRVIADRVEQWQEPSTWSIRRSWNRLNRTYRRKRFESRSRLWPAQLAPHFPFECLGPSDSARQELAELRPLVSAAEWNSIQVPTPAELKQIKEKMRWTPNALGWLIAQSLLPRNVSRNELQRRARLVDARRFLVDTES